MQSEDELLEDEEEMLVYVEFEGLTGSDTFSNQDLQLDMIGIDTEHPIMEINGRVCCIMLPVEFNRASTKYRLHLNFIYIFFLIALYLQFYEGTYEDAMGTYMFFEKDDNPKVDDEVFDKVPTLKYFAKTRKLLKMQRVFTKPRVEILGDSEHDSCIPNTEMLSQAGVPPRYQQEGTKYNKFYCLFMCFI